MPRQKRQEPQTHVVILFGSNCSEQLAVYALTYFRNMGVKTTLTSLTTKEYVTGLVGLNMKTDKRLSQVTSEGRYVSVVLLPSHSIKGLAQTFLNATHQALYLVFEEVAREPQLAQMNVQIIPNDPMKWTGWFESLNIS